MSQARVDPSSRAKRRPSLEMDYYEGFQQFFLKTINASHASEIVIGSQELATSEFMEYRNRVLRYYNEKRYRDALEVALAAADKFRDHDAKTSFWIACLQSRLGYHDEAIQTLQGALKRQIWWPDETLQDPDLEPIRSTPEFRAVEAECARLRSGLSTQTKSRSSSTRSSWLS